jgi:hypothetical protein
MLVPCLAEPRSELDGGIEMVCDGAAATGDPVQGSGGALTTTTCT